MDKAIAKRERCGLCRLLLAGAIMGFLLVVGSVRIVGAYKISPRGTRYLDRLYSYEEPWYRSIVDHSLPKYYCLFFIEANHECATNMIYDPDYNPDDDPSCGKYEDKQYAPNAVLAGNQWNDNPPFILAETDYEKCKRHLDNNPLMAPYAGRCWKVLFDDAIGKAKKTKKNNKKQRSEKIDATSKHVILYRVHAGDMQFVHSMASKDGETAFETRENIIAWAEFTYRLAIGDLLRSVKLHLIDINRIQKLFYNKGWSAQYLFITIDRTYHRKQDFKDLVFGSLLHMVQDSFVRSHAHRSPPQGDLCSGFEKEEYYAPGKIIQFYSYTNQDTGQHSGYDTMGSLFRYDLSNQAPNCVEVGKVLKQFYDNKTPWVEVEKYMRCIFDIEKPDAKAGPGDYVKH